MNYRSYCDVCNKRAVFEFWLWCRNCGNTNCIDSQFAYCLEHVHEVLNRYLLKGTDNPNIHLYHKLVDRRLKNA